MQFNIEDPSKEIPTPEPVTFRAVYRRRGSDLVFSSTKDGKVMVSRRNHRTKKAKHYLHSQTDFAQASEQIKAFIAEGKYKNVEAIAADIAIDPSLQA